MASSSPAPEELRRARLGRWLGPVVALVVLVAALVVLQRELRDYHYHDVLRALHALPGSWIAAAFALTALAYAILPGYDALALAYAGERLPLARTAFGSAIAYGLSQTLGFPLVTGGAVRYRFWSAWGLSTEAIARAVSFVGATFTLGIVVISAAALLLEPRDTLAALHLPIGLSRVAGIVLLATVAAYLGWSLARAQRALRVGGWEFPVPAPGLALGQIVVAVADWAAAGAVLYVLLPDAAEIGFLAFLGVFVLAQFAGLASHVPGGIGVFETVVVLLMRPHLRPDQTLGVLLAYRVIYYLIPFFLALLAIAAYETARRRARLAAAASSTAAFVGRWGPAVLPQALSATTFIGGAILLFSGATPSVHGRVRALDAILPLGIIELSHFVASVTGAGLVVLSWALRRRLDAAWGLTVVLLGVGIVGSLLKGLDWEEAVLLATVLLVVLPTRRAFYRRATLTSEPLSPEWIVAIALVVVASGALGLFAYKRVDYSADLWWRFSAAGDAPRFLRATAGALAGLVVFGMTRLLRHPTVEPELPDAAALARAHAIVERSAETSTALALLGDKALLFSERGSAFLMYGVEGRSWVALGDPVGPPEERRELAWRFREEADRHGGWTVFYEVGTENLPLYIDLGLTLLKLGEKAIVPLETFSLEGGARKGLRRTRKEVTDRGAASFEVVPPAEVEALLPTLREISDRWLAAKATREKGFSLGYFDERYLRHFPVALVRSHDRIVAFANLWLGADHEEVSVDLMRFGADAPRGVMEYLFIELLLWAKAQGYRRFSLGMAPLAGLESRALAPLWSRVGAFVYRHGEHFYNFQGLRLYKNKFDPVWEPRYIASPGGLVLPRVMANVAALISGGIAGVVRK